MGCFRKSKKKAGQQQNKKSDDQIPSTLDKQKLNLSLDEKKEAPGNGDAGHIAAHTFTFRELAAATKNFRVDCLLGEGGFGRVYKGQLQSTSQYCKHNVGYYSDDIICGNYPFLDRLWLSSNWIEMDYKETGNFLSRKAIDPLRVAEEQNLVAWARPLFKDRRKFSHMADPTLQGQYPMRGMYQALAVAAMCVHEQPNMRPLIADVVTALNYLASQKYGSDTHPVQKPWFGSSTTR
nr:serine/threonine-protein kinase CDL1-like [Ipomoea batatas]